MVSIIIPTYNRVNLIGETLDSVIGQTYKNWECIIVDDGCTDNTENVISEFSDSRIKYYKRPFNKKKGASSCRNYGLEIAKGKLIQFLDDDDLLDKNKLAAQVKAYSGGKELLTCKWGGFTDNSDFKSRFKYRYHSYKNFKKGIRLLDTFGLYNEFFPLHIYLTPRKLIDKAGGWNEELSNNDDAEFFTRIILASEKINFVPGAIGYYRYFSPHQLSALNSAEKIESLFLSWELIENRLKNKRFSTTYVKRAKHNLFQKFQENPTVIKEYQKFFKGKRNYDSPNFLFYKRVKQFFPK